MWLKEEWAPVMNELVPMYLEALMLVANKTEDNATMLWMTEMMKNMLMMIVLDGHGDKQFLDFNTVVMT